LERKSDYEYYECIINGQAKIHFDIRKGKVSVPYFQYDITPLIMENIENNNFYQSIYSSLLLKRKEKERLLKAIEWFNSSFTSKELDGAGGIIHLETAFEALFKTTHDGIKPQVKSVIIQLIGESKELLDWVDQFWKLRNGIVHGDVDMPPLWYTHRKGSKGHRHHLEFGRRIFTRCVDAFLKLKELRYTRDIHEDLISNEVRLKEAKKILQPKKKTAQLKDAFHFISGLTQDDLSALKKDTAIFGKLFLPHVIRDLQNNKKSNMASAVEKIIKWSGSDYVDLAMLYDEAFKKYQKYFFSLLDDINIKNEDRSLRVASYHFLDFAGWRLLTFYD
jgi:hypothetical protein